MILLYSVVSQAYSITQVSPTFMLFNWSKEKEHYIYKLFLTATEKIVELMSVIDVGQELRIEIHLIEVSKENRGRNKLIEGIAGCLIAYACRLSFDKGYQGFVSLIPKTKIINLYIDNYGFKQFGRQLALDYDEALLLIDKYLNDEK
jgi:hypothetical protein